jgi:hypothetical protein
VRGWIRERTDDLELLDDGSRPPVRDDHRKRILVAGTDVNEVDVQPINVRRELRQGIQLCFHLTPVVAAPPVPNQLLQLGKLRTLRLIGDGFLIGPTRCQHAAAQVGEGRFRHVDAEGAHRLGFGCIRDRISLAHRRFSIWP